MSLADFPDYPPAVQAQLLNGPAMVPPSGIIPNLVDPRNHNGEAIAVSVLCLSLSAFVGSGRLYSRLIVSRKLQLEDYLGILAFGPYVGLVWAFFKILTIGGFFVHQWDIRLKDMFDIAYYLVILPICYCILMMFTKTAILLEWTRIFVPNGQHNAFFWVSRLMMSVNIALYTAAIIATAFSCVPLEKLWHTWVNGKCIDRKSLDICTASFNLAMDLLILFLPQNVIWKLQMSKSRKIGVSVIFSVGILACVCAAGRVYSTATLNYLGDTTYGVSKTALWSLAETTCVLVVFCMPALPKAFSSLDMDNILDKLASLRSWSRLKSLGSRRTSQDKSGGYDWPAHTTGSEENNELKAYPIGQGDRYTVEALTLAEVKLVQERRAKLGTSTGPGSTEGNAILRTTEIGQEASYNTSEEFDPYLIVTHERQHPWVGGER